MVNDYAAEMATWLAAGFTVTQIDMFVVAPHPARRLLMMQAAIQVGMKVIPQPDENSWGNSFTGTEAQIVTQCVNQLMPLVQYMSAWYQDAQGRYVISPYNALVAENGWDTNSPSRWAAILDALTAQTGKQFALNINLANGGTFSADIAKFKAALGTRLTGAGLWGGRSPQELGSAAGLAGQAHALGIMEQQWLRIQDNRRRDKNYSACLGSYLLRASWLAAIQGNAEMVLAITADDDYEASSFSPRLKKTDGWLWLTSFYLNQWRDNAEPSIIKDAAFVAYRLTPFAAVPTATATQPKQTWPVMTLNSSSNKDQDITEFISFLTDDAQIIVDGNAPVAGTKGVNVTTIPQKLGTHRITIVRNGVTVVDYTTKQATVPTLPVQYLEFICEGTVHDRSYFQTASDVPANPLAAQLADMTAQRDSLLSQVTILTANNATLTAQQVAAQAQIDNLNSQIAAAKAALS